MRADIDDCKLRIPSIKFEKWMTTWTCEIWN